MTPDALTPNVLFELVVARSIHKGRGRRMSRLVGVEDRIGFDVADVLHIL